MTALPSSRNWNTNYKSVYAQIGAAFVLLHTVMVGLALAGWHCIGLLMIDKTAEDKLMMHYLSIRLCSARPSPFPPPR